MLDRANRDIEAERRRARARREQRAQLGKMVRAIDGLLFQLEDLNLQGVDRVPSDLRSQAGRILESLPDAPPGSDGLRVRFRVMPMMDVLFQAQELLFKLRDPGRRLVSEEGEEEEDRLGA